MSVFVDTGAWIAVAIKKDQGSLIKNEKVKFATHKNHA